MSTMGKIKTVIMGDEQAEQKAREKDRLKREQKKLASEKKKSAAAEPVVVAEEEVKTSETETAPASQEKKSKSKKSVAVSKYRFTPGKKHVSASALVDKNKSYSLSEALALVKKTSYSKFDGTVELHVNVTDKGLRGSVTLPHGTGKQIRVKIADDSLIADLEKSGKIDFDILVAHPSMMPKLAKIAKILGPRGLMPNPKTGTIGENPEKLVDSLAKSVNWKTQQDFPIVHTILGKVSFEDKKLQENYLSIIKSISKDKIQSVFLKATMGPAVKVSL